MGSKADPPNVLPMSLSGAVTLNIERRPESLPRAKRRGEFAGDILTMNVRDFVWAEYGEYHHDPGEYVNLWMAEEYRMEILEVIE